MDNFHTTINKEGYEISLIGIADPEINTNEKAYLFENNKSYVRNTLNHLTKNLKTDFNILLSHRPELLNVYKEFKIDLVFSGHTHGGQIRIPFVGGIFSPNQGFFPKLSEGMHKEGLTTIVVSRGLGNSVFPFRIFNRPELVVVTLNSKWKGLSSNGRPHTFLLINMINSYIIKEIENFGKVLVGCEQWIVLKST